MSRGKDILHQIEEHQETVMRVQVEGPIPAKPTEKMVDGQKKSIELQQQALASGHSTV